jgi:hypothetical protein
MRKFPLAASVLALAFACQSFSSHATTATTGGGVTAASQVSGPVTVSVSTSGYAFTPLIGVLDPPPAGTGGTVSGPNALPPQGFTASVALINHTASGITCALSVTGTPGEKFEFSVYNAHGKLIWDSLPTVLPPLEILETLAAGDSWHGSVFVPLIIDGKPLAPGTYTLQASLFGTPVFSATTSFVVNNVIAIN